MIARSIRTALVLAAVAGAAPGAAQGSAPGAMRPDSARYPCREATPASELVRVPYYLEATTVDSSARRALPGADAFVRTLAGHFRALLGATAGATPAADSVLRWWNASAWVRFVARADGTFHWRSADEVLRSRGDSGAARSTSAEREAGAELLERALGRMREADEVFYWPDGVEMDSATFVLQVHHPGVGRKGVVAPFEARYAVELFTLPTASETPVEPIKAPRVHFPSSALGRADATIVLNFVVDTNGRAVPETIRDVWPVGVPKPTGDLARHYDAFLRTVTKALLGARFEPARVGRCPVRQLVQQPFIFGHAGG